MSDDEGKVLTQGDIDAMLSTIPQSSDVVKSTAPAATAAPKPPEKEKPAEAHAAAAPAAKPAPAAPAASAPAAPAGQQKSREVLTVEIIDNLQKNCEAAQSIIAQTVQDLQPARRCQCGEALKYALITDKSVIAPETRSRLEHIVGKYMD